MIEDSMPGLVEEAPVETPVETDVVESPVETDVPTESQEQTQEKPWEGGRPSKTSLDKIFKGIEDKRLAEHLRGRYFKAQDYEQVYPSVQEARDAKETLEIYGGSEGIEAIKAESQEFAATLAQLDAGDPAALRQLASENPEAILNLAGPGLDLVRSINPQAYGAIVSDSFSKLLESNGFPQGTETLVAGVGQILDDVLKGNQAAAADRLKHLYAWMEKISGMKSGLPKREEKKENPFAEREQAVAQKEQSLFVGGVAREMTKIFNDAIREQLTPLTKGKNITQQQLQGIVADAYSEITNDFKSKEDFQRKQSLLLEQKNGKQLLQLVKSRMGLRGPDGLTLAARAVKKAWASRGFGVASTRTASTQVVSKVNQKPRGDDVDWTKDRNRERYMRGEATLKNGKTVRWDWNAV